MSYLVLLRLSLYGYSYAAVIACIATLLDLWGDYA